MKDTAKVLFWLVTTVLACVSVWKCGHVSGEAAARQRYHESVKRVDACRAAGGNAHACKARFAPW